MGSREMLDGCFQTANQAVEASECILEVDKQRILASTGET